MYELINSCDSVISLHRAEGFGLHLAEAMAMGKAVIATNWSGNVDFMNSKNSYLVDYELIDIDKNYGVYKNGSTWAEPSISSSINLMKIIIQKIL